MPLSMLTTQDESSSGGASVNEYGIILMSTYLVTIFSVLLYSLVAIWPRVLPLAITSIKPEHGPAKSSNVVNIVGTGFADSLQVFFGGVPANSVTRKSDNLLIVTTPENQTGSVTIEIDSSDGHKSMSIDQYVFDDGSSKESKLTPTGQSQQAADT